MVTAAGLVALGKRGFFHDYMSSYIDGSILHENHIHMNMGLCRWTQCVAARAKRKGKKRKAVESDVAVGECWEMDPQPHDLANTVDGSRVRSCHSVSSSSGIPL